jgi:hypothetical protein
LLDMELSVVTLERCAFVQYVLGRFILCVTF